MAIGVSLWIRKKDKERRRKHEIQKSHWVKWVCEEERRENKIKLRTWLLWPWVPTVCVYLPKGHGNSVSITQKHLKCVFSFHNSSLKNHRIEWWKQNLKTNPNKLSLSGSHHFWVMSNENRVMGDGN